MCGHGCYSVACACGGSVDVVADSSLHVPVSSLSASHVFTSLGVSAAAAAADDDDASLGFASPPGSAFTSMLHSVDAYKQLELVFRERCC